MYVYYKIKYDDVTSLNLEFHYFCYYPTRLYQCAHPTHIYMSHVIQILKNPPEYTMRYSVQPGRNTKNEMHAHLLGNA